MKMILPNTFFRLAAVGSILAASVVTSRADVAAFINTFDDTNSFITTATYNPPPPIIRFEYGTAAAGATHSVTWSTNDAQTNANSGSVKLSWNWVWATTSDDGSAAFAFDLFNFANTVTNASNLSFDIMVDPSSAVGTNNGYGYFEVATRDANYAFNKITSFNAEMGASGPGVWHHYSIPLTGINSSVRALTFQDYNDTYRQINGAVTIYVDNLTLSVVGQITNVLTLTPPPDKGLIAVTTGKPALGEPAQYQRQNIRSVASTGFSWIGAEDPMTYSLTITNYPAAAFSNFLTYVILVQGTTTAPNPDYASANVIYLDIQNQADGSTIGTFRYKVDDSGANDMLYGSGTLGSVTSPTALGTWSMTFSQDTNITVTAPNGATLTTNIPGTDADVVHFSDPVRVYFGDQPNTTNNVGQLAVYSHFQIVSNSTTLLNDTFTSPTLNTALWAVSAEDPSGILQISPDTSFLLSWNLPDTGYRLITGTNLLSPETFRSNTLPVSVFLGRRTVPIPAAMLVTNNPGFFRLISP
jgi:hypothetical protein